MSESKYFAINLNWTPLELAISGDGLFQNRQTAPDNLQLLPVLAGRGRSHYRGLLSALVHGPLHHEEVAVLRPPLRHLPCH